MSRRCLPALAAVLLSLAVLAAGCAQTSGSRGAAPTSAPSSAAPPKTGSPTPTGSSASRGAPTGSGTVTIELWLTRDGTLAFTRRTRPATVATTQLAIRELIAGPTAAERTAGVRTALPSGLTYTASVSGEVATVSFPRAFYDGGRDLARLRQAQVVYTLTQYPTVRKVGFQVSGEPAGWPVDRTEYADLLPAIVVTSPLIGQSVSSPVTIAGTANTYEATVNVRILDASGTEIATGFTTATCGTGCRGRYATTLAYRVAAGQPGRIQVYEISAEDGSRVKVVDIPVTLTP
ncbi:MAG: Gmad2 immunoglobulin-like domain-containing protein [Micromonosporaceae bacterium]